MLPVSETAMTVLVAKSQISSFTRSFTGCLRLAPNRQHLERTTLSKVSVVYGQHL
jgi:hypothetical protein